MTVYMNKTIFITNALKNKKKALLNGRTLSHRKKNI